MAGHKCWNEGGKFPGGYPPPEYYVEPHEREEWWKQRVEQALKPMELTKDIVRKRLSRTRYHIQGGRRNTKGLFCTIKAMKKEKGKVAAYLIACNKKHTTFPAIGYKKKTKYVNHQIYIDRCTEALRSRLQELKACQAREKELVAWLESRGLNDIQCKNCQSWYLCHKTFGVGEYESECDFYPSQFKPRKRKKTDTVFRPATKEKMRFLNALTFAAQTISKGGTVCPHSMYGWECERYKEYVAGLRLYPQRLRPCANERKTVRCFVDYLMKEANMVFQGRENNYVRTHAV